MTVRTGNLLYTSGHLPISLEGEMTTGKVREAFFCVGVPGHVCMYVCMPLGYLFWVKGERGWEDNRPLGSCTDVVVLL